MLQKVSVFLLAVFALLNTCGCALNMFKPAMRIGPTVWQEGVLSQNVRANMEQCISATEKALEKLNYEITKKTVKDEAAEIMSNYPDGRIIWIEIKPLDQKTSKLEIRVGATGEKEPEIEVFKRVIHYLRKTR